MLEKIKALNMLSENINPTIIYNEGWIVRLLVIESMLEKITKIEYTPYWGIFFLIYCLLYNSIHKNINVY